MGKSTMTYHLAYVLAQEGKRVLVVDSDPQGNMTLAMGREPLSEDALGLAHVLSETRTRTVYPGRNNGLGLTS